MKKIGGSLLTFVFLFSVWVLPVMGGRHITGCGRVERRGAEAAPQDSGLGKEAERKRQEV